MSVRSAIAELDLDGQCICLHSSFRTFDSITPDELIDGFLDEGCTLMVPTFSWDAHAVRPPDGADLPERNGTLEHYILHRPESAEAFTVDARSIDLENMGIVPATVVERNDRVRGNHPLSSFCAIGPRAKELVDGQTPEDVFAPIDALAAAGGVVVLAGVGLSNMTLLHQAERLAGRQLFLRWGMTPSGRTPARAGGCSQGFEALAPVLAEYETHASVAGSPWRIYDAARTLAAATAAIWSDPEITRCADPECLRCDDQVAGGPVS